MNCNVDLFNMFPQLQRIRNGIFKKAASDSADRWQGIIRDFGRIAEKHGVSHHYGFLTPMDLGRRAILEYDYYADQADEAEKDRVREAMTSVVPLIEGLRRNVKGVTWMKHIVSQGFCRSESLFYT